MSGERLEVCMTFDSAKGYVAMVPDLAESLTALSLDGLRRRIGAALLSDIVDVRLVLDRAARGDRDRRGRDRPVRRISVLLASRLNLALDGPA